MKTIGVICRNKQEFQNYIFELLQTFDATKNLKTMGLVLLVNDNIQYVPIIKLDDLTGREFNSLVILERVNEEMIFNSMNRIRK